MHRLPSVKSGLLSGLSCMTVGCAGIFEGEPSRNSASNSASNGAKPTIAVPGTVPASPVQPGLQKRSNAEDLARSTAVVQSLAAEEALWAELRQGRGYVILMRHALAPGTGDPPQFRLEDCSTQRNLSAAGRQQAKAIGAAFRQQNIPVNQVLSSQWCRCLETAKLLDLGAIEPFPALNSFFSDRSTASRQTEQVQAFIREQLNRSGVTILVTHQVNITAISNIVPESGELVVLKAVGGNGSSAMQSSSPFGGIEVKGRLSPAGN